MFLTPGSHAGRKRFGGVITSNSSTAFAVGPFGTLNPTFQVDASTALDVTGIKITGAASGAGVAITTISSATNEALSINAKGSGQTSIATTSTGSVSIGNISAPAIQLQAAQTRLLGTPGGVQLTFANDNFSGFGQRATGAGGYSAGEFSAYASLSSTEVMRWTGTVVTAFSTLTAASTLTSNVTRTIASANLQAGTAAWADVEVLPSTTTISGSTNVSSFVIAKSQFDAPVLTASAAAVVISNAMNVYIAGPPTTSASGGFTPVITAPWALWVNAGITRVFSLTANDQVLINPSRTLATTGGLSWSDLEVSSATTILTGTTTINAIARVGIFAGTLQHNDANTSTVTLAEGLYVEPPTAGTGVTITNNFAARFAGNVYHNAGTYINFSATSGTGGYGIRDNSGTIEVKNSGGSWSAPGAAQGNQLFPIGQWYAVGPQLSATTYAAMAPTNNATETAVSYPLSRSGTLKNFRLKTLQTQSGTGNMVFTVMVNGAATSITLTVVASDTAQTYADTTHTATIAAGDTFSIRCANAATATGSTLLMNIQFD